MAIEMDKGAVRERVDFLLGTVRTFWEELPEVASAIDGWHGLDRLDFTQDQVVSMRKSMGKLRDFDTKSLLTAPQSRDWEQVQKLAEERQPLLDRILSG